jgi:D-glycero-D-manno-heptose 1,7-bisphosphate phosphatase
LAILVGGLGSRLGSLSAGRPKPLVDIAGVPFLETLIGEASRRGFKNILLLAGHHASQVLSFAEELANLQRFDAQIAVSVEPEPLGTAGAISYAADRLEDEFLLLNGDSWFDFNWLDLAVQEYPNAVMVMALRHEADASRFGVVDLAASKVTAFQERGTKRSGLINGGVYLCRHRLLDELPKTGSLESLVLPKLAREGRLGGRVYDGFFIDIGVPSALAQAQIEVPRAKRRRAAFLDRDGVLNIDHGYVHRREELTLLPGAVAAVKHLNDSGYYVFVITNQAGIARGYYEEEDVRRFHAHLASELRAAGASIDDFRYCPHHPDGTREAYAIPCGCRKPAPGMILDLMKQWPVEKEGSFVVGDKPSDMDAAAAAGLPGHLFDGGNLARFIAQVSRS